MNALNKLAINEERLFSTFIELVGIASPSGKEGAVAAYCRQILEDCGWQVCFDDSAAVTGSDTGNLTATLATGEQGEAETIVFSAHMDTVEPASGIEPICEGDIIKSAGETILGGDDKVGIAVLLELAQVLAAVADDSLQPLPTLMIVLSVQEEVGLVGAKAYDCESLRGKPCFVLDAAGRPGNVVIGAPYQRSFTVAVTGLAAHAGVAPQAGVSAITAAARAIAKFEWGRLDEQTTANVGKISGGTANNIVAPDCVFTGECRSQNLERLEQVQSDIEACINREIQAFGAESAISWEDNYDGFYRSPSDPLVKYCLEIATALGLPATTEVSGGGADTNVFASRGANALSLGTGMTDIHTTNETLAKSDLIDLARYVLALVVGWQKEEQ